MAGQRGLHGDLGGFEIADLADHDDVRVLAHQRADAFGKAELDVRLHLHLVEAGVDELDRILDRADVDLRCRQLLEARIQRRGLAGAGRAGHQHDAVRLLDHRLPALCLVVGETELAEVLDQHFRIEDAHDQLLAEGGRQRRAAQLDLLAVRRARLDAAVLRLALLGHVHARQDLDPAGHRGHDRGRDLVDLVQHAVDAEAHVAGLAARLEVDVARARVEGVLQQPVDDVDDVLVVGRELTTPAEIGQLLERARAAEAGELRTLLAAGLDAARERVELDEIALDVDRIRDHAAHRELQRACKIGFPFDDPGLAGRDRDFARRHFHRQDLEPRGVRIRHHGGDARDFDRERVDAQIRQAGLLGEPDHERLEREPTARLFRMFPVAVGNARQRVLRGPARWGLREQLARGLRRRQALRDEPIEQRGQRQRTVGSSGLDSDRNGSRHARTVSPNNRRYRDGSAAADDIN